jgi:hypothetical protein
MSQVWLSNSCMGSKAQSIALHGSGSDSWGVCSLRLESSQEHLPTSIAGVLRLRAIKSSVCDRSAKRFAQDDGFVKGLEIQLVGYAENTKRSKKSHAPEMTILLAW